MTAPGVTEKMPVLAPLPVQWHGPQCRNVIDNTLSLTALSVCHHCLPNLRLGPHSSPIPTWAHSFLTCFPGKAQTQGPGSQRPTGLPTSALLPALSSVVDLTHGPSPPSPRGLFTLAYPSGVGPGCLFFGQLASPPSQPTGSVRAAPRLPFLAGAPACSRHSGYLSDGWRAAAWLNQF